MLHRQNHLYNFGRGQYGEHSHEIILNKDQMSFKEKLYRPHTTITCLCLPDVLKLGPDSTYSPPGKLGRSDSQIGRSYSAKIQHFLSV